MTTARIFCIDDDLVSLEFARQSLQAEYTVGLCSDPSDALNQAAEFKPDLILLDIMMPIVDGIGLLELLKSLDLTKSVPVVLLSAKADDADLDRLLNLGARGLIEKGVAAQDLREQVAYALANPSQT